MALNPILNVYRIELNPTTEERKTFENFIRIKYSEADDKLNSNDLFNALFKNILLGLGDKEFVKDKKAKKVVGIQKNEGNNQSMKVHSNEYILEGVLEGGKYDILRQYANINNKAERGEVKPDQAVLDKYYFLLYMPLNSYRGVLMIQSYTEETIQSTLIDTLKPLFSADGFYNLKTDVFVPERLIDDYKKDSSIRLFKYSTTVGIGSSLRNSSDTRVDTFEVVIELKPKGNIPANTKEISEIISVLDEKVFDDDKLEEFEKKVFIEDSNKRKANFDLKKQIEAIRPTIYLEDYKIRVDENTGQPNFTDVKDFCFKLLEECKNEIERNSNIDEF